jgi:hypothetical protein
MEVHVQLHTLVALPPVPIWQNAGLAPDPAGHGGKEEKKIIIAPARNGTLVIQPIA